MDRRDFYHQAQVGSSRARSNMLPFKFPTTDFEDCSALINYERSVVAAKLKRPRDEVGDELAPRPGDGVDGSGAVYAAFGSLFQGDHLGVEFALASHEQLLRDEGLLHPPRRILGHCSFPYGPVWEALVIDDYFCISSEPISAPTFFKALAMARLAYERHRLEGSTEKDVVAEFKFKAAGAEVDSSPKNVLQGLVSVSAPLSKRIALSTLSLRTAVLPAITSRLASRLAGNWVSVLLYRRCLSSVVDSFFGIAASCQTSRKNKVVKFQRSTAEELVTLAALAPLISTNVALPLSRSVYASDASNSSGAVVSTEVEEETAKALWFGADKKGHYTRLDNPFGAGLQSLGVEREVDDFGFGDSVDCKQRGHSPFKPLLLYFDFVEICGGSGSLSKAALELGLVVAPTLDLSDSVHYDLGSPSGVDFPHDKVKSLQEFHG